MNPKPGGRAPALMCMLSAPAGDFRMRDADFESLGKAAPDRRTTFNGLMERAWSDDYGWLVSFDGYLFFQVSAAARLSNVEAMEREVAGQMAVVSRKYFELRGIEVITVVSNRLRKG